MLPYLAPHTHGRQVHTLLPSTATVKGDSGQPAQYGTEGLACPRPVTATRAVSLSFPNLYSGLIAAVPPAVTSLLLCTHPQQPL
jgi:hypothetical protein